MELPGNARCRPHDARRLLIPSQSRRPIGTPKKFFTLAERTQLKTNAAIKALAEKIKGDGWDSLTYWDPDFSLALGA